MTNTDFWSAWRNQAINPSNQFYNAMAPHYEIIKVRGKESAQNFKMSPNSSTLLLDETQPIVWLAQTDGTGYLTITPFSLSPYEEKAPIDLNDLAARISKLEEQYAQQSNSTNNRQPKKQRQPAAVAEQQSADTTT